VQLHDLASAFQNKTDDELLLLASEIEQLTPEAQSVLHGELSRRRLGLPPQQGPAPSKSTLEPLSVRDRMVARTLGVSDFITEVVSTYHRHWWLLVKLITPAVVITYVATLVANNEIHQMTPHLSWRDIPPRRLIQVEAAASLARLSQYLVSWFAFSFAFAAICSAVRQSERGDSLSVADCFADVRARTGEFVRLSLLLFFSFLTTQAVAIGVLLGISALAYSHHFRMSRLENFLLSDVPVYLALLIFSRFSLAIPAFLWEGCRVGKAMFRSDELTEGQWLNLAALLGKSGVGGYVAGMLPFWLAAWFLTGVLVPW
jgi:hypothetical protein